MLALTTAVMARGGSNSWTSTIFLLLAGGLAVASRRREGSAVVVAALGALGVLALITPRTASAPAPRPDWVDPTLAALPAGTRVGRRRHLSPRPTDLVSR